VYIKTQKKKTGGGERWCGECGAGVAKRVKRHENSGPAGEGIGVGLKDVLRGQEQERSLGCVGRMRSKQIKTHSRSLGGGGGGFWIPAGGKIEKKWTNSGYKYLEHIS